MIFDILFRIVEMMLNKLISSNGKVATTFYKRCWSDYCKLDFSYMFWTSFLVWSFINNFDISVIKKMRIWCNFGWHCRVACHRGLNKADQLEEETSTFNDAIVSIPAMQQCQLEFVQTCICLIRSALLRAVHDNVDNVILTFGEWLDAEF